ncbi:MAG: TetR/AcrR family transcriptional regulator [Aeromicrobium sp.]
MTTSTAVAEPRRSEARERLLSTAAGIFYAEGIRTVGVDRIIAEASVTKATFYRHFPSKDDLALAYLRSVDIAIRGRLDAAAETADPFELLRIVGGGIADDLCRPGYRGCAFINAAAEYSDPDDPIRQLVTEHRAWFQQFLVDTLARAGHPNPVGAANHVALMRDGAMVRGYLSDPTEAGEVLMRGIEGTIRFIKGEWPEVTPPPQP